MSENKGSKIIFYFRSVGNLRNIFEMEIRQTAKKERIRRKETKIVIKKKQG